MRKILLLATLWGCASTEDQELVCPVCVPDTMCDYIDVEIEDSEKKLGVCLDKLQACDLALKKHKKVPAKKVRKK